MDTTLHMLKRRSHVKDFKCWAVVMDTSDHMQETVTDELLEGLGDQRSPVVMDIGDQAGRGREEASVETKG